MKVNSEHHQARCSSEPPTSCTNRSPNNTLSETRRTMEKPQTLESSSLIHENLRNGDNKEMMEQASMDKICEGKDENDEEKKLCARNLRDTIKTRFLSMIIGCLLYLIMDERRGIKARVAIAADGIDWIHIGLYVLYPLSLVSISQLAWDFLHNVYGQFFLLFNKGSTLVRMYKLFSCTLQGLAGLLAYFLAKQAMIWWKDFENKGSCLERSRITKNAKKVCEYHILRLTVAAEKYVCENASHMCSKTIYLLPYLLSGGILIFVGLLVVFEYFLAPDIFPDADEKIKNLDSSTKEKENSKSE